LWAEHILWNFAAGASCLWMKGMVIASRRGTSGCRRAL